MLFRYLSLFEMIYGSTPCQMPERPRRRRVSDFDFSATPTPANAARRKNSRQPTNCSAARGVRTGRQPPARRINKLGKGAPGCLSLLRDELRARTRDPTDKKSSRDPHRQSCLPPDPISPPAPQPACRLWYTQAHGPVILQHGCESVRCPCGRLRCKRSYAKQAETELAAQLEKRVGSAARRMPKKQFSTLRKF